jgi:hypothetical protein
MSPERYARTKDDLTELVALGNDLVHHLMGGLDTSDEKAAAHL